MVKKFSTIYNKEGSISTGTLFFVCLFVCLFCVCVFTFPDEQVFQASPVTSAGAEARGLLH